MTDRDNNHETWAETTTDDSERALTTAADVESAGRSCIVIIAMVAVILVLLGIWVLYTTA